MRENVKPESEHETAKEKARRAWMKAWATGNPGDKSDAERAMEDAFSRLAAPAAPGIREAAEDIATLISGQRGVCARPDLWDGWRKDVERILLSRLGASGKAGWTKEPKEPGQYWCRSYVKPDAAKHVVRLFHYDDEIGTGLFVASQGDEITDPLAKWEGCEFLGPIPVPEE